MTKMRRKRERDLFILFCLEKRHHCWLMHSLFCFFTSYFGDIIKLRQRQQFWPIRAGMDQEGGINGVQCIGCIVPMRLSGGAYAVYQQLSKDKRRDFTYIKRDLYTAFALNSVSTWKEFMARKLHLGETVDFYLVKLLRLAVLFGGMPEKGIYCKNAWKCWRITLSLVPGGWLDILEVLAWTRAILKKGPVTVEQAAAAQPPQCQTKETNTPTTCYKCDGPNHLACNCLLWHKPIWRRGGINIPVLCYKYKKRGHIAWEGPGKRVRGQNFGTSFFPQISSKQDATHGEHMYWWEVHIVCGHWLHSNPGVQVMLSDVGKKGGSRVNCW